MHHVERQGFLHHDKYGKDGVKGLFKWTVEMMYKNRQIIFFNTMFQIGINILYVERMYIEWDKIRNKLQKHQEI